MISLLFASVAVLSPLALARDLRIKSQSLSAINSTTETMGYQPLYHLLEKVGHCKIKSATLGYHALKAGDGVSEESLSELEEKAKRTGFGLPLYGCYVELGLNMAKHPECEAIVIEHRGKIMYEKSRAYHSANPDHVSANGIIAESTVSGMHKDAALMEFIDGKDSEKKTATLLKDGKPVPTVFSVLYELLQEDPTVGQFDVLDNEVCRFGKKIMEIVLPTDKLGAINPEAIGSAATNSNVKSKSFWLTKKGMGSLTHYEGSHDKKHLFEIQFGENKKLAAGAAIH